MNENNFENLPLNIRKIPLYGYILNLICIHFEIYFYLM